MLLDQKVSCNRRAGAIVGNDAFDKLQDQKAYSSRECALPCQRVELNAKRTQGSWPRPFSAGKGEKNDQNTFGMPVGRAKHLRFVNSQLQSGRRWKAGNKRFPSRTCAHGPVGVARGNVRVERVHRVVHRDGDNNVVDAAADRCIGNPQWLSVYGCVSGAGKFLSKKRFPKILF